MTRRLASAAGIVAAVATVAWTAAASAADLPASKPTAAPKLTAPLSPAQLLAAVQAEREAYNRRLDVCHRLREVAVEVGDDKLETQALDLEQKATALYQQRVARLGVKSDLPAGSADPIGGGMAVAPPSKPTAADTARPSQYREVAP